LYKIRLLLIICFSVLYSDDITSSCKDFEHQQCLIDGWKFENANHRDALKNYTKAKDFKDKNSFVKSYKHIIKARDIIKKEQILNTKMKKNIYTGSALRPRVKIYKTNIENIYNIKSLELDTASKNTAQPILIVECSSNENNLYVYNIDKSFKKNIPIENMDLVNVTVKIDNKTYNVNNIKSGEMEKMKIANKKCNNLKISLNGNNSLFDKKSISQVKLSKKGQM
jgi:hypothetical protein